MARTRVSPTWISRRAFPALLLLILVPLFQACIEDPVSLPGGGSMEVRLHVTGGVAGADYEVFLDGGSGILTGLACRSVCDFQPGQVLQVLRPGQVEYLWTLFHDAGILELDGEDYGTQCCDQFHYGVDYRDARGRSRIRGSSEVLPEKLRLATGALQGMASGTLPIVVDFETTPPDWPRDPLEIQDASILGQTLRVRVAYGGGCQVHDLGVVAWSGWMESSPVQVRAFISHEDFDDPCDAWITRELEVDLGPLKLAYQDAYGTAPPGETTLVLWLADPMLMNPQGARRLEYVF